MLGQTHNQPSTTSSIDDILAIKKLGLSSNKTVRKQPKSSIEKKDKDIHLTSNSIELPAVKKRRSMPIPDQGDIPDDVDELITNKLYRYKYLKLIREGHLRDLVDLARIARERGENPVAYFLACTRTTRKRGYEDKPSGWERSLKFLEKWRAVEEKAMLIAQRVGTKVNGFIRKQVWNGKLVERWASVAQESGRDRMRYFIWLCQHQDELLTNEPRT